MTGLSGDTGGRMLCVGRADAGAAELAGALGAPLLSPPEPDGDEIAATVRSGRWAGTERIETWASELGAGEPLDRIAVVTWLGGEDVGSLTALSDEGWFAQVEFELALWARAIVALAERAADGASIVVVVDRPGSLDAAGHAPAVAVAEGLGVFARSAAFVQGERMVRVNTVATSLGISPEGLVGMAPALPTFPGTITGEVAGAVRALWSPDTLGVTGTVLAVDGGRSW